MEYFSVNYQHNRQNGKEQKNNQQKNWIHCYCPAFNDDLWLSPCLNAAIYFLTTRDIVNSLARPINASRSQLACSLSIAAISALEKASRSFGATNCPYFPFSRIILGPPGQSILTTGVPTDSASTSTLPKPSQRELSAKTDALRK